MQGQLTTIKPDGTITVQPITSVPSLEDLQSYVGGYIEMVPMWEQFLGRDCIVFCHEEGKLHGDPVNEVATSLWKVQLLQVGILTPDILVGTVIIIAGDEELLSQC